MTKNLKLAHLLTFLGAATFFGENVSAWQEFPKWFNELFGDGDFGEKSAKEIAKHLSRQQKLKKLVKDFGQLGRDSAKINSIKKN